MLTLSVWEAGIKPSSKFLVCDFAVKALVTLDECFVFPFLEIVLKNGVSLNPGKISLVIFIVNCNGGVVRHFLFVVFHCHYVLTIFRFALGNTVAVISIIISFHYEIPAATLTFSKTNIQLKHFCKFKLKHFHYRADLIVNVNERWYCNSICQILCVHIKFFSKLLVLLGNIWCICKSLA